jgi:tripartite-type tricarboxylate transporter receptor subunit TctC
MNTLETNTFRGLTRRHVLTAASGAAVTAWSGLVQAQASYPSRPITVILPFPAGGTTDRIMRSLTQLATGTIGQPFVIDNKPGAATLIAAQALMRARPDGYTIGLVPMSVNRLRALGKTNIDTSKDFSYIARVVGQTHGLVARSDSRFHSVADVVKAAKEKPDVITYGTSGVATHTHVAMEDFAERAGIRLNHIPFKGGTESLKALLAGEIDLLAESPLWAPHVDNGQCRLLATWNAQRVARYPSVPTMRELGYPLVFAGSFGLGGPAGIESPVLARLRQVFKQAILSAEFKTECESILAPIMYLDGEDFRKFAQENFVQEKALAERLKGKLVE